MKTLFLSFAHEDRAVRDTVLEWAYQETRDFTLVDMHPKVAWDSSSDWHRRCREKVRRCDGLIVFVSANTIHDRFTLWELGCANEAGIPVLPLYADKEIGVDIQVPPQLLASPMRDWKWGTIADFANRCSA